MGGEIEVKSKKGRNRDPEISKAIYEALKEIEGGNVETIRKKATEIRGKKLGWTIAKKRLENMVEKGMVKKIVVSNDEREIATYLPTEKGS